MRDAIEWLGNLRVENLADFGVLADTVEVIVAVIMMIGGIYITHRIQVWADKAGEHPGAVNVGLGGGTERYEQRGLRD
ncbi:MAG TPA: hypothetical protein VIL01_05410 [Thermomicrobiales bacterium]